MTISQKRGVPPICSCALCIVLRTANNPATTRYLRKLQEAASGVPPEQRDTATYDPSPPANQVFSTSPQSTTSTLHSQGQLAAMEHPLVPILSSSILPVSKYYFETDAPQNHYFPSSSLSPHSSYGGPLSSDHTETHSRTSYTAHHQHQSPSVTVPSSIIPPLSYFCRPHRLEDIASRDTFELVISLFFDFVHPLTPCIHKPSFMADLHANRAERDPLFFALVMSTVASTLVQVPRSYVPMDRATVKKLARTCYEASRHITVVSYDPPSSTHVVIRYL